MSSYDGMTDGTATTDCARIDTKKKKDYATSITVASVWTRSWANYNVRGGMWQELERCLVFCFAIKVQFN